MISLWLLIKIPKFHQPKIQSSLLYKSLLQRSNFSTLSHPSSSSQESRIPNLANHKDWLSPNEAIKIFQSLKNPDFTLPLFNQISQRKDYNPNEALYTTVINKLALAKNFDAIETLLEKIKIERKCRLSEDFFVNVIRIYGNLGGRINSAIRTLFDMPSYKCWPSVKSFNFVLNLLVSSKQFEVVHEVYMSASRLGVEIDACSLNILIKGLCQCGKFDAAFSVFDEFPKQNFRPNVRTFSTIMHSLCHHGRIDEALLLLDRMERDGIEPDAIMFNTLISGLRKNGRVVEGIKVFDRMMVQGCDPNPGTYQEILYSLLDDNRFVEAKEFMCRMIQKGMNPSFESYKLVIQGFCSGNLVGDMDWALKQMIRQGFVPKMGMWKRIVQCLVSGRIKSTTLPYEEIVGS
ncbi:hypothetical protein ACH5RR_037487 [Cinchona calisaya]|uniref:Pentatricopeptide repeat-containing protein n=1 Tax=Cinchona calisaya TaxID=153742 RepID=A0ABD2Y6B8_9GENT